MKNVSQGYASVLQFFLKRSVL